MSHAFFGALALVVSLLCWTGMLPPSEYTDILKWIIVGYVALSCVLRLAGAVFDRRLPDPPAWPPPFQPDENPPGVPLHAGVFQQSLFSSPLGQEFPPEHTNYVRDEDAPPVTTDACDGELVDVPVDDGISEAAREIVPGARLWSGDDARGYRMVERDVTLPRADAPGWAPQPSNRGLAERLAGHRAPPLPPQPQSQPSSEPFRDDPVVPTLEKDSTT
jgi:hypothetical protein